MRSRRACAVSNDLERIAIELERLTAEVRELASGKTPAKPRRKKRAFPALVAPIDELTKRKARSLLRDRGFVVNP